MTEIVFAGGFIISAILSILIISNPISTSAVFITLTDTMSHKKKLEIAKRSIKFSLGLLIFFSITGFLLFQIFGFSLGAFRIAGGILLFTTATTMMNLKPASHHRKSEYQDIALIPLSIPFTSGPGTIITVVILMSEALAVLNTHDLGTGLLSILGVYLGIAVVIISSYLMMARSESVNRFLKEGGRRVITRLMGLLVMAIAVQFMINGVIDIIPELIKAASV